MNFSPTRLRQFWLLAVIAAFAFGIFVREHRLAACSAVGFDESLYERYTAQALQGGFSSYPKIVEQYIALQERLPGSILHPLRFLYIGVATVWCKVSGAIPIVGLRQVSAFFSILTLAVTFGWMGRMAGWGAALAVLALMACAPTQIHMSAFALLDGFVTFWATLTLWTLWEALQKPERPALAALYGLALFALALTKENAAFVWLAIVAILFANRWLRFGAVSRPVIAATVLAPVLAMGGLMTLAGGFEPFRNTYVLAISRNYTLDYAILTGDGPWYRYVLDLLTISPVVTILALAMLFQLDRRNPEHRALWFVSVFVGASYLVMCNLKYGMNLRYANMWDSSLRLLAFAQLGLLAGRFKRPGVWLAAGVVALCLLEFRQYWIFAVDFNEPGPWGQFYEMVPQILLRAVHIIK